MNAKSGDDDTVEEIVPPARRYQWNAGYSRENEYEKNPSWAVDMRSKIVSEADEEKPFDNHTVKFYDKFDPEHIWIKSDNVRDLTDCL